MVKANGWRGSFFFAHKHPESTLTFAVLLFVSVARSSSSVSLSAAVSLSSLMFLF